MITGDNDELNMENELEKLKMQAQFGAKFFPGNMELPPELEAEWLKNVRAFEEQYQNAPPLQTMAQILGNPGVKPLHEISQE